MGWFKDDELKKEISALREEVRMLRRNQEYVEPGMWSHMLRYYVPPMLKASEIIQRFDELYQLLNVERKHQHSCTKLEKKEKK